MIIHNPILTGSFTVNGTDVSSITSSAASLTSLNSYTASQNILNGTYATTGSNTFAGIQTVNSNLVVTGSITAQTLVVQTVTSSVVYSSGSNVFGNDIANTQVFTGSMNLTGSLTVVTTGTEFQVNANGVKFGNVIGDAHSITGSVGISGSLTGTSATFSGDLTIDTNTLYVDSTNNRVGIGRTDPTRLLDVSAAGAAYIRTSDRTNSVNVDMYSASSGGGIGTQTNHDFILQTNNTQRLLIAASTGAATFSSANQALGGSYSTTGNVLISTTDSFAINKGGSLSLGGKYNTAGAPIETFARIHGKKENSNDGDTAGYLAFETVPDATALLTERMRITSVGEVQISNSILRLLAPSTTSVSTSATTISTGSNTYGGLAIVWGADSSGNIFTDLLFYSLGQVFVIRGQDVSGGPFGRTYTVNGSGALRLTMGGGTYSVRYQAVLTS
jgi:hypothetical protein